MSRAGAPAAANDTASWLRGTQQLAPMCSEGTLDAVDLLLDAERWRIMEPGFAALRDAGASAHTALRGVGLHWWSQGQPARAVQPFLAALLFGPESADVLLDLGSVLQAAGRRDEGLAADLRATQIAPDDARPWLKSALLLQAEGKIDAASAHFEMALACDAGCGDAAAGLGMIRFGQKRYTEAAQHLAAVASNHPDPTFALALGQALYLSGDFAGAAKSFRPYVAAGDADVRIRKRYALCRMLECAIAQTAEEALAAWREAAGEAADDPGRVIRQAFDILRGYGHRKAALQVATLGSVEIHPYLVDVLRHTPIESAPTDFIVEHFNGFAEDFDTQLVKVLGYDVPRKLAQMIAHRVERPARIVDLGCGTGLCGIELSSVAGELIGVDLSANMLAKARDKGVYDGLHEADVDKFLETCSGSFDGMTLADVLIYRGPLQAFFKVAAKALTPSGLLAFSVETTDASPYELRESGRFAHNVDAIYADVTPWFDVLDMQATDLRQEANAPVAGALFLLQRKTQDRS